MTDISTQLHGMNFAMSGMYQSFPLPNQSLQSEAPLRTVQPEYMQNGMNITLPPPMQLQGNGTSVMLQPMDDFVSDDIKSVCTAHDLPSELGKRSSYDSLPDFYSNYHDFSEFHKRSSNIDLNAEYAKMRHSDSFEHLISIRSSESVNTMSTMRSNDTLVQPMRSSDPLMRMSAEPVTETLDMYLEPDFSMFVDPTEDAKMVMNDIQRRLERQRSTSSSAVQDQARRERRMRRMSETFEKDFNATHEPPMDEDGSDDAKPRKQTLKFENDLYTPHWVRYQGSKKEGYCDLCKPGRWLQLKTSAYWYLMINAGITSNLRMEFLPLLVDPLLILFKSELFGRLVQQIMVKFPCF
jgi:hypothetical protein